MPEAISMPPVQQAELGVTLSMQPDVYLFTAGSCAATGRVRMIDIITRTKATEATRKLVITDIIFNQKWSRRDVFWFNQRGVMIYELHI